MNVQLDANALGQSFLSLGENGLTAVLGYAVVFAGLLMLMVIVILMGAIFKGAAKRKAVAAPVPAAAPAPVIEAKTAPGAAGEVKRFDVPDKEAAMLMAIVADQMGKPLNELRFLSIKEVKEDEI